MSTRLDIIFEDEALLAINKPAWLLSVPGRAPEHYDSVASRATDYAGEIFIVHRLDCATSGIMLLAKTKATERHLDQQFRDRQTHKEYIAVGAGIAPDEQGIVDIALAVDWPNRPKQKFAVDGKQALTRYQVLKQSATQARLRLWPITGRSHQLRLHMLHLGLPIVGDRLYAPEAIANASERTLLHAELLRLTHPLSGEQLELSSPCPF